jgi:hypothetical protein
MLLFSMTMARLVYSGALGLEIFSYTNMP